MFLLRHHFALVLSEDRRKVGMKLDLFLHLFSRERFDFLLIVRVDFPYNGSCLM